MLLNYLSSKNKQFMKHALKDIYEKMR